MNWIFGGSNGYLFNSREQRNASASYDLTTHRMNVVNSDVTRCITSCFRLVTAMTGTRMTFGSIRHHDGYRVLLAEADNGSETDTGNLPH